MNSETFRMKRFLRLLGTELRLNASGIGYVSAALFCVLITRWALSGFIFRDRFIAVDFGFFLLTGGLVLASMAFMDLSDAARMQAWLLIPASRLEKYLSRYLLTSWLAVAGLFVVYLLFALTVSALSAVFPVNAVPADELFRNNLLVAVQYFLILQPIFFLGSAHFRRWAFPKTILTAALFSLFLCLFTTGLARLVFRDNFFIPSEELTLFSGKWRILPGYLSASLLRPLNWQGSFWAFYFFRWWPFWLLPPLFLLVGYHTIKETEQTHGIS
jgi:hypothetical protein